MQTPGDGSAASDLQQKRRSLMKSLKEALNAHSLDEVAAKLGLPRHALDNLSRPDRSAPPELIEKIQSFLPNADLSPLRHRRMPDPVTALNLRSVRERLSQRGRASDWENGRRDQFSVYDWHSSIARSVHLALERDRQNLRFEDQLLELFERLKEGECFVLFAVDQPPMELHTAARAFDKTMAEAVGRGVKFIYVVPKRQEPQSLPSVHGRLVHGLVDKMQRHLRDWFDVSEVAASQIMVEEVEHCPFFIPSIQFALEIVQENDGWECYSSIGLRVGIGSKAEPVHLPLPESFAESALSYMAGNSGSLILEEIAVPAIRRQRAGLLNRDQSKPDSARFPIRRRPIDDPPMN